MAYVNPATKKSMKGGNYMKAKDYYKKIVEANPQTADEFGAITGEIVSGLNKEAKELIISRKAQRNDAVRGIVRELNNKWNAIVNLYEKDHDFSPFRRNAYWDCWVKEIPELDPSYDPMRVTFDYSNPNVLTTLAMLGSAALGE